MPSFRYAAIDRQGVTIRGDMDAANEAELIERIRERGLLPVRMERASGGWPRLGQGLGLEQGLGWRRRGFTRREVANMTRELAIMLSAGQDLDRAMRFLIETAPNPRLRAALETIRASVRDGNALAVAIGAYPARFPRFYVGLVRAGEASGKLADTLERLAAVLERERAIASSIRSAMIYPAMLFVAMASSVAFLLTSVLPQFVPLFTQNNARLPASTQAMIDIGHVLSVWGLPLLVAAGVAGLGIHRALQRPSVRLRADRWVLRVPVAGRLAREVLAARFCRTLGTLMINGVPLIAALGIVREAMGNRAAADGVQAAALSARGGAGLAGPLAEARIFPERMLYLLRLGEETAQIGLMCLRAADIHDEEARLGIQRLVSLLLPAITIVMGAIIAGIVSSLVIAMLSLNDLAT